MKIKLFESFIDDILQFKSKKNSFITKLGNEIKSEMDEYMHQLLDEFQHSESIINVDIESELYEVIYEKVTCKFDEHNINNFVKNLRGIQKQINNDNEVEIFIYTKLYCKDSNIWTEVKYGNFLNIDSFERQMFLNLPSGKYEKIVCTIKICSI